VAFPVLLHAADERGRARPTVSAAEPLGSQRPVANATYDPTQPANVAHRTRRQNDGFSARSADAERHFLARATIGCPLGIVPVPTAPTDARHVGVRAGAHAHPAARH
jgi:hypothetical protein